MFKILCKIFFVYNEWVRYFKIGQRTNLIWYYLYIIAIYLLDGRVDFCGESTICIFLLTLIDSWFKKSSNRSSVVQDQKVLSEVPNRDVLPSVFSAVQFKTNTICKSGVFSSQTSRLRCWACHACIRLEYMLKCISKRVSKCIAKYKKDTQIHANT